MYIHIYKYIYMCIIISSSKMLYTDNRVFAHKQTHKRRTCANTMYWPIILHLYNVEFVFGPKRFRHTLSLQLTFTFFLPFFSPLVSCFPLSGNPSHVFRLQKSFANSEFHRLFLCTQVILMQPATGIVCSTTINDPVPKGPWQSSAADRIGDSGLATRL